MKLEVDIKIVLDPKEAAQAHKLMQRGHDDSHIRDVRDPEEKKSDGHMLERYDHMIIAAHDLQTLVAKANDGN